MARTVMVWVVEGTWPGCVDAVREWAPDDDVVLLHVTGGEMTAALGALGGLLGRGSRARDRDRDLGTLASSNATELLDRAAERLGRGAETRQRTGRIEREVVEAAEEEGADLLVCARDGDRSRLGPRSLGAETRFVVDHAPCPVMLVWPEAAPDVDSIPPPPPPGHEPPPPPHERP